MSATKLKLKFNSTYELLIYLGKENLLTTFVYEEYHKSTQVTLFDGDNNEAGILLTPEIDSQLLYLLRNYCSMNTDGEFNFYGYDLLIDEENRLQFKLEKHLNADFSQSFRLEEFVSAEELCDIFSRWR